MRAQEQGRGHSGLEPHNTHTLDQLRAAVDARPKDRAVFQKHAVDFHLRNAAAWADEATGLCCAPGRHRTSAPTSCCGWTIPAPAVS
ncbi:hypothetical protein ACFWIJ_34555 [Streptomyces sp. NPDC127079]|uniref:hypothetical protein n=1 Tax=Streptomyces sp. NPDC127079 TaxID=3347132 RepID=UPI003661BC54